MCETKLRKGRGGKDLSSLTIHLSIQSAVSQFRFTRNANIKRKLIVRANSMRNSIVFFLFQIFCFISLGNAVYYFFFSIIAIFMKTILIAFLFVYLWRFPLRLSFSTRLLIFRQMTPYKCEVICL